MENEEVSMTAWREWDQQVSNFSLVTLLNTVMTATLVGMSQVFDLTDLFDIANWDFIDIYLFLGPVLASVLTLVMVESSTWLAGSDFGISNERQIYLVAFGASALVQIVGNGGSVLLLAVYTLVAFIAIPAGLLLLLLALIFSLTLLSVAAAGLVFVVPILTYASGLLLEGSFLGHIAALGFDAAYFLLSELRTSWPTIDYLHQNGLASTTLGDFRDTLTVKLGVDLNPFLGFQEILEEIIDDSWVHVALHAFIVLPIVVLVKIIEDSFSSSSDSSDCEIGATISLASYGALLDLWILKLLFPGREVPVHVVYSDYSTRRLAGIFFNVEALYWGIYFLVRQYQSLTMSDLPSLPGWSSDLLSDLTNWLPLEFMEDPENHQLVMKLVVLGVLLPLVQVLTWVFQIPFFEEMKDFIRSSQI